MEDGFIFGLTSDTSVVDDLVTKKHIKYSDSILALKSIINENEKLKIELVKKGRLIEILTNQLEELRNRFLPYQNELEEIRRKLQECQAELNEKRKAPVFEQDNNQMDAQCEECDNESEPSKVEQDTHLSEEPCETVQTSLCDDLIRKTDTSAVRKILEHTGFECSECQKRFRTKYSLKRHCYSHTGLRPYFCDHCGRTYSQAIHLDKHVRKIHDDTIIPADPFKCTNCNKEFENTKSLRLHFREHKELSYSCDWCARTFIKECNRDSHVRKIHEGEHRYSCGYCDMMFSQACSRNKHIKQKHSGDRPFKCDICEYRFAVLQNLKDHLRIHSGERPYACNLCDRTFTQSSNRDSHFRQVHNGVKCECDICPKRFSRKQYLKKHMQQAHGPQQESATKSRNTRIAEEGNSSPSHSFCRPKLSPETIMRKQDYP